MRLDCKQLTADAGFLVHFASQRLTVMVESFHGHHLSAGLSRSEMQPLDPYSYSLSGTLSHNWERGKGCEGDDRGFPASSRMLKNPSRIGGVIETHGLAKTS
jgi:hypothetical protein